MKKEDLEKMTVPKLREEAGKYEEITGTSGMKKAELIEALWEAMAKRGEAEEEEKEEVAVSLQERKSQIKKEIRELKSERDKALKDKDRANLKRIRRKIKKARRKLKRLAIIPSSG